VPQLDVVVNYLISTCCRLPPLDAENFAFTIPPGSICTGLYETSTYMPTIALHQAVLAEAEMSLDSAPGTPCDSVTARPEQTFPAHEPERRPSQPLVSVLSFTPDTHHPTVPTDFNLHSLEHSAWGAGSRLGSRFSHKCASHQTPYVPCEMGSTSARPASVMEPSIYGASLANTCGASYIDHSVCTAPPFAESPASHGASAECNDSWIPRTPQAIKHGLAPPPSLLASLSALSHLPPPMEGLVQLTSTQDDDWSSDDDVLPQ
jgi:hypothetical protein